jgi:hypothetical protein
MSPRSRSTKESDSCPLEWCGFSLSIFWCTLSMLLVSRLEHYHVQISSQTVSCGKQRCYNSPWLVHYIQTFFWNDCALHSIIAMAGSCLERSTWGQCPNICSPLTLWSPGYFQTWMYISVPLVLYVGERMLRALRSNAHPVKILKVSRL